MSNLESEEKRLSGQLANRETVRRIIQQKLEISMATASANLKS